MRYPISRLLLAALLGSSPLAAGLAFSQPAFPLDFGSQQAATRGSTQAATLTNNSTDKVTINRIGTTASGVVVILCIQADGCPVVDAEAFWVSSADSCVGKTLAAGESCTVQVAFRPTRVGIISAMLEAGTTNGLTAGGLVTGRGLAGEVDCVLDWAQKAYASQFAEPLRGQPRLVDPFYGRCYLNDAFCIGADVTVPTFAPPSFYLFNKTASQRIDTVANIAKAVACEGFKGK